MHLQEPSAPFCGILNELKLFFVIVLDQKLFSSARFVFCFFYVCLMVSKLVSCFTWILCSLLSCKRLCAPV